ncbi:type II secretion system protein [Patescibacteria group bacterium]|nr:MAG: type II secretion system protein [Patescibacteria group bacterium]
MKNTKQGFTLIELLVVIAIIAVLASIIITGLNTSRVNARAKTVQQSLASAKTAILLCVQGGDVINPTPTSGAPLCDPAGDATQVWPPLPTTGEWFYVTDANAQEVVDLATNHGVTISNPSSDVADGSLNFAAYSVVDDRIVSCTETGCIVE